LAEQQLNASADRAAAAGMVVFWMALLSIIFFFGPVIYILVNAL
jgi:hypothetical protein